MSVIGDLTTELLDPRASFLVGKERNVTSQWGEDGLIEALFDKIGTRTRWCFEVGAADGVALSNTKRLRDQGWEAVLIEADPKYMLNLYRQGSEKVRCVHAKVDSTNLDYLLRMHGAPEFPDFGVIDVDGPDYRVWDGMKYHRPRVMLVEFCAANPQDHICKSDNSRDGDQSGLQAIIDLGISKGYRPLTVRGYNVLFVHSEAWEEVL